MPDGDFDAQYEEVADEPRTSIGPLFESGGTFDEKLADLCQDIVEEYGRLTPTLDSEGNLEAKPQGTLEDPAPGGPFQRASYAAEINQLALEEFPVFFDAANIDRFAEISSSLKSAADAIVVAENDGALGHLQSLLTDWEGPTASNFGTYLDHLGTTMVHQLAFVGDVGAATTHFEELMKRMRVDAYGLANNLMAKVSPPHSDDAAKITNALMVMGLIAAGVATFGTGALVGVAGAAAVSEFAIAGTAGVVQIQQSLQHDEVGDREIQGEDEEEYIPSCRERIEEILTTGQNKADLVMGALQADMSNPDFRQLFLSRPEIIGMKQYDEDRMTLTDGFRVGRVAELRRAGTVTMPSMAQYFEDARRSVSQLAGMFEDGVGQSVVAGAKTHTFALAVSALEEAFTHLRDDLYNSGRALTAIADNYARTEEQHADMMRYFNGLLDDPGMEHRETYQPRAEGKRQAPPRESSRLTPVPGE